MNEGYVAIGIWVVGFIVWLARLEAKTGNSMRDIERMERRQDNNETKLVELDNRVMEKLSKIETIVAKIEGKMSRNGSGN